MPSAEKISQKTLASVPLDGTELVPLVQAGVTHKTTVLDIGVAGGPPINLRRIAGATGGDGTTDDTATLVEAFTEAMALSVSPHIYVPPGVWVLDGTVITYTGLFLRVFGPGIILFKNGAQIAFGTDADYAAHVDVLGVIFQVDSTSTVQAPVKAHNVARLNFEGCRWWDLKKSAIDLRVGTMSLLGCKTRVASSSAESVIHAALPAGLHSSITIDAGCNFSGAGSGSTVVLDYTGAGVLDGFIMIGSATADMPKVINATPSSGGQISNFIIKANLFDSVEPGAFNIVPGSGAVLSDFELSGNTINGNVGSAATSGNLINLDLTSGATMADEAFKITDNTFKGPRLGVLEVVGGTFKTIEFSRNTGIDLNRAGLAGARYAKIAGTIDRLEMVFNGGRSIHARDYDFEVTATVASRRIEHNSVSGTAPTKATYTGPTFDLLTRREVLYADLNLFVSTTGSDTNAGRTSGDAFATLQKAVNVACSLDLNGHIVTIQAADGTYSAGVSLNSGVTPCPTGGGFIIIQGNSSNRSAVVIDTAATCFTFNQSTNTIFRVKDLKMQSSGGDAISVGAAASVQVNGGIFGAVSGAHLRGSAPGARIILNDGNSQVVGNMVSFMDLTNGAEVEMGSRTVTLTGSITFTTFFNLGSQSLLRANNVTYAGTFTPTGKQYSVVENAVLRTNSALAGIPGPTAGTTDGFGIAV